MLQKEWALAPRARAEHLARYRGCSPILAQILYNRGFEEPAAAIDFLHRRDLREDPFELQDMPAAVARISNAIAEREPIAIYGDFDADGVCATALLAQTLGALGGCVQPYIPDREREGYGLNTPALERLARRGFRLVVTVDCGIRSHDEVIAGKRAGLDIIITDHHSIGSSLPPALAVINPRRDDCAGEARLAGAGVAFMLAKALLQRRWQTDRDNYPAQLGQSDLLDLVALGTIADVLPLNVGLNRRLVRHGLATINEMRRPGIAALAQVAGLKPGGVKASDIGFGLGPRINAAGRLRSAMIAYDLLMAESMDEAMRRAIDLQALNAERQRLTREALAAISDEVGEDPDLPLIFAGDEGIPSGIVGLVAGRLAEARYRPAVVLAMGPVESRASCRSIPEFDITRALDECADLLARHGGHAMAAGFTARNSNLDLLERRLTRMAAAALGEQKLAPRLPIDIELPPSGLTESLMQELELLEPTGHENESAAFLSRGLRVLQCRRVGEDGRHLKFRVADETGKPVDGIGFGLGDWARRTPRRVDVVYQAEMNEWQGRRRLQMRALDIQPADEAGASVSA